MPPKPLIVKTFEKVGLSDLQIVADAIITAGKDRDIWLFEGEMGAGKTTLISVIGQRLRIVDDISSPTFSIVNEYADKNDEVFYHFDFYRIEHEHEALDIGVDEYFHANKKCFIEWSEKIPTLVPEKFLRIFIFPIAEQTRKIVLEKI